MINNFYSNKKILITGHTGFKGAWLSLILKVLGNEIYGLSDNKRKSGIYKVICSKGVFKKEFIGDIRDEKFINKSIKKLKIHIVFHFAAQGLVSEANSKPRSTIETNIIGTYNLLQSCNDNNNIQLLVIATTDKVYENHNHENTEKAKLGGKEFYSASKASSEHIIQAFINTKKRDTLSIGVVRAGNVLGGGDYAKDRILTDIISSLKKGEDIILRNPKSIRPWQYILDSINGYLMVGQFCVENKVDSIFNLNSSENNKNTVLSLATKCRNNWGEHVKSEIKIDNSKSFYESNVLTISSKKANRNLKWNAKYDLEEICVNTIKYEQSREKYKFLVQHIKHFFGIDI
jgi:CDP-glucose 4,6-dehydratase